MKTTLQNGQENKFYIGLLIAAIVLLVVFFTSKTWMYDDNPIMQTPYHAPITGLDQTTLQLNKWEYNPEQELMEVSIETIHSGSDIVKPTFYFTARESGATEDYPVKVVFKDDNNVILQIENVPEKYKVIGLIVQEYRDEKVLRSEVKEQTLDQEETYDQDGNLVMEENLAQPKPSEKVIVGDYRTIKMNNSLVTKDAVDYQIENVEREIEKLEKQIKNIVEERVPLQVGLIESLEIEIASLEVELEYQTKEEQQDTLREIQSKKDAIEDAIKNQEEYMVVVEKLMERHERQRAKLDSIRADNGLNKEERNQENEVQEGESESDNSLGTDDVVGD